MKNRVDTSRNKTPWDNIEDVTTLQSFIKNKYNENYKFKHPKLTSSKEYIIINSIEINSCRYCNSLNIIKRGRTKNNIQIYYCKLCKKRFTPTKGTIFENHKISITEWIEFLLNLFNNSSTNLVSKNNKNGINTSIFWLQKVFLVLDGYQDNISLSGNVYIDETYYKVIKSDILKKQNGKEFKGISYNQYCIGLGYDGKNIIAISEGLGKTSSEKTKKAFIEHIEKNSTLIHDEEKSHNILIEELSLKNIAYNSSELKGLDDKDNPLRKINHQCDLLKKFLNSHSGFDRENLQNYLNLYCFIYNCRKNRLEKVEEFLKLALNKKVSLKYRDLFDAKE